MLFINRLEFVVVLRWYVAFDLQHLGDGALARLTPQLNHQIERFRDLLSDHFVGEVDPRHEDAGAEP